MGYLGSLGWTRFRGKSAIRAVSAPQNHPRIGLFGGYMGPQEAYLGPIWAYMGTWAGPVLGANPLLEQCKPLRTHPKRGHFGVLRRPIWAHMGQAQNPFLGLIRY